MQDPLTSSFRWGETFDTAPLCQSKTCNNKRSLLNNSFLLLFVPTPLFLILVLMEDALREK